MLGLARASGRIRGSRTLAVSLCGGLAFGGAVQSCRVVSTHSSGALQVFPGPQDHTSWSYGLACRLHSSRCLYHRLAIMCMPVCMLSHFSRVQR